MAHKATDESALNKHAVMKGQVLIVATSHDRLGFDSSAPPTGLWLGELAEPFYALKDGGFDVTIASPSGGKVPIDEGSLQGDFKTPECTRFLADDEARLQLDNTVKLSEVKDPSSVDCIFIPGGHGPCYDLASSQLLADILTKAAAAGVLISAVCHGPVGLVLAKAPDGKPLVAGKRVTGFTNSEEEAVGKTKLVPWLLEDKLKELGAIFERQPDWNECVVVDGNLITGQNPGSARKLGEVLVATLNERHKAGGGVTTTAGEAGLSHEKTAPAAVDAGQA